MWQSITANWKTSLGGLITILLGIPTFVSAIQAWGNHQVVDWRSVLVSTALIVIGIAFGAAKDGTTHSTPAQVAQSGREADKKALSSTR